jgi:hypothetical protein
VWNAGFRGLINRLAPEERERFRQEHLAEIQTLSRAEGLWLEVNVLYAVGIRPMPQS